MHDRNQVDWGDDGVIAEVCTLLCVIVVHCGCCSVSQVLIWSQPVISVCVRRTPGSRWRCVRTRDFNIRGWKCGEKKMNVFSQIFYFYQKNYLGRKFWLYLEEKIFWKKIILGEFYFSQKLKNKKYISRKNIISSEKCHFLTKIKWRDIFLISLFIISLIH